MAHVSKTSFVSPLCAPTRCQLVDGAISHPHRHGERFQQSGDHAIREETTIAELFKANGYSDVRSVWEMAQWGHYPCNPNGQGFDEFIGFCAGHTGNYFDPVLEHNAGTIETQGFITDVLTTRRWSGSKPIETRTSFATSGLQRTAHAVSGARCLL